MIFGLSSIPGHALPQLQGWLNADKFVHLAIYGVLGALCWFGARGTLPPGRGWAAQVAVAVLIATLYGITDEAHQSLVPMRSPDVYDVIADAGGALIGALLCVAIVSRDRVREGIARRADG
jgi:VanZ family protein